MKHFVLATIIALILNLADASYAQDPNDRTLSLMGDAEAGRITFLKCQACHSLEAGQNNPVGPNLANIFGRMAGTSQTYTGYSKALKESGIIWNESALDEWMKNPQNFLPGNKMPFAGIRAEQDRKNLLAYLRSVTENK